MTPTEFRALLHGNIEDLFVLVADRNENYGGTDPLRCWRKRGLGGLIVRFEDKLHRFEAFLESGATEEQWRELLFDIGGYALCGLVWLASGEPDEHVKREGQT